MKMKRNGTKTTGTGRGFCKNTMGKIIPAVLVLMIIPFDALSCDEEDPIYKKCMTQKDNPAPWCYLEEVKKNGNASLCENITKYWPRATGVRGQCYYELARKKMNCELCKRIRDKDIKKMCELDVCK
jgi:hypothetical protein